MSQESKQASDELDDSCSGSPPPSTENSINSSHNTLDSGRKRKSGYSKVGSFPIIRGEFTDHYWQSKHEQKPIPAAPIVVSADASTEAMVRSLLSQTENLLLKCRDVPATIQSFQLMLTYLKISTLNFPIDLILDILRFLKPLTAALDDQPLLAVSLLEQAGDLASSYGVIEYQIRISIQMPLILLNKLDLHSDDSVKQLRRAVQECAAAHLLITKYLFSTSQHRERIQSGYSKNQDLAPPPRSKIEKLSARLDNLLSTLEKMFLVYAGTYWSFHPNLFHVKDPELHIHYYNGLEKLANHLLRRGDYQRARQLYPTKLQTHLLQFNASYSLSLLKTNSDINQMQIRLNGVNLSPNSTVLSLTTPPISHVPSSQSISGAPQLNSNSNNTNSPRHAATQHQNASGNSVAPASSALWASQNSQPNSSAESTPISSPRDPNGYEVLAQRTSSNSLPLQSSSSLVSTAANNNTNNDSQQSNLSTSDSVVKTKRASTNNSILLDILNELEQDHQVQATASVEVGTSPSSPTTSLVPSNHFTFAEAKFMGYRQEFQAIRRQIPPNLLVADENGNLDVGLVTRTQLKLTMGVRDIIASIIEQVLELSGPPPCNFCIIGLGSHGRYEVAPYSDLEFALMLEHEFEDGGDDGFAQSYFGRFVEEMDFIANCIGEPTGFRLDTQGTPKEFRFRGSPSQIIERTFKNLDVQGIPMAFSLLQPTCLYVGGPPKWSSQLTPSQHQSLQHPQTHHALAASMSAVKHTSSTGQIPSSYTSSSTTITSSTGATTISSGTNMTSMAGSAQSPTNTTSNSSTSSSNPSPSHAGSISTLDSSSAVKKTSPAMNINIRRGSTPRTQLSNVPSTPHGSSSHTKDKESMIGSSSLDMHFEELMPASEIDTPQNSGKIVHRRSASATIAQVNHQNQQLQSSSSMTNAMMTPHYHTSMEGNELYASYQDLIISKLQNEMWKGQPLHASLARYCLQDHIKMIAPGKKWHRNREAFPDQAQLKDHFLTPFTCFIHDISLFFLSSIPTSCPVDAPATTQLMDSLSVPTARNPVPIFNPAFSANFKEAWAALNAIRFRAELDQGEQIDSDSPVYLVAQPNRVNAIVLTPLERYWLSFVEWVVQKPLYRVLPVFLEAMPTGNSNPAGTNAPSSTMTNIRNRFAASTSASSGKRSARRSSFGTSYPPAPSPTPSSATTSTTSSNQSSSATMMIPQSGNSNNSNTNSQDVSMGYTDSVSAVSSVSTPAIGSLPASSSFISNGPLNLTSNNSSSANANAGSSPAMILNSGNSATANISSTNNPQSLNLSATNIPSGGIGGGSVGSALNPNRPSFSSNPVLDAIGITSFSSSFVSSSFTVVSESEIEMMDPALYAIEQLLDDIRNGSKPKDITDWVEPVVSLAWTLTIRHSAPHVHLAYYRAFPLEWRSTYYTTLESLEAVHPGLLEHVFDEIRSYADPTGSRLHSKPMDSLWREQVTSEVTDYLEKSLIEVLEKMPPLPFDNLPSSLNSPNSPINSNASNRHAVYLTPKSVRQPSHIPLGAISPSSPYGTPARILQCPDTVPLWNGRKIESIQTRRMDGLVTETQNMIFYFPSNVLSSISEVAAFLLYRRFVFRGAAPMTIARVSMRKRLKDLAENAVDSVLEVSPPSSANSSLPSSTASTPLNSSAATIASPQQSSTNDTESNPTSPPLAKSSSENIIAPAASSPQQRPKILDKKKIVTASLVISRVQNGLILGNVLLSSPQILQHLDRQNFTDTFFASILMISIQRYPDEVMMQPMERCDKDHQWSTRYRLIMSRHTGAWGEGAVMETKNDGSHDLLVKKNIIFCLDQMQEPLDADSVCQFLEFDAPSLIGAWLKELKTAQARWNNRFAAQEIKKLFQPPNSLLPQSDIVSVSDQAIPTLMKLMHTAKSAIQAGSRTSHLEILKAIHPVLGHVYAKIHSIPNLTPLERFACLSNPVHVPTIYRLLPRSSDVQQFALKGVNYLLTVPELFQQIQASVKESNILSDPTKLVTDTFHQSRWELFHFNPALQEKVLEQIDCKDLSIAVQTSLLGLIESSQQHLHDITLRNSDLLDNTSLEAIIRQNAAYITKLHLPGCQRLENRFIGTGDVIKLLAENCTGLTSLDLSGTNIKYFAVQQLTRTVETKFEKLEWLFLDHCRQLEKVKLNAPSLWHIDARNCTELLKFEVNAKPGATADLYGCSKIVCTSLLMLCGLSLSKHLSNLSFNSRKYQELIDSLEAQLNERTRLRIEIGHRTLSMEFIHCFAAVIKVTNLTEITLNSCELEDEAIRILTDACLARREFDNSIWQYSPVNTPTTTSNDSLADLSSSIPAKIKLSILHTKVAVSLTQEVLAKVAQSHVFISFSQD